MIYNDTQNTFYKFSPIWAIIDYLLTSDITPIKANMIEHLNISAEPDAVIDARLQHLWTPYQYSSAVVKLISNIFSTDALKITSGTKIVSIDTLLNIDGLHNSALSSFKRGAYSFINYGGVASVIVPRNNQFMLYQLDGKNIIDICKNNIGVIEFIKWKSIENHFDPNEKTLHSNEVIYEYYIKDNKVILEITNNGQDGVQTITGIGDKIPVVGANLIFNDDIVFRGTPYLYTLALSCIKLSTNSANIDYLLEEVLRPRLVYQGASPIKAMSMGENARLRGIKIGTMDKLSFLEHSGGSINAARDQLERYLVDIQGMTGVNSTNYSGQNKSAFEVAQIKENEDTLKTFVTDRLLTYYIDVLKLAMEFRIIPPIENLMITFEPTGFELFDQNMNTTVPKGKIKK